MASGSDPTAASPKDEPVRHAGRIGNVTGALLLGGRSTRMGRDKARLEWQGEAWSTRIARLLDDLFEETLLVGGEPEREAPGARVADPAGPACALRGLVGALAAASAEVAISVHNSHPIHPIGVADVLHHDSLNIDITETPGTVYRAHGVMSWRTYQGKARVHLTLKHCLGDCFASTRGNIMAFSENSPHFRHTKMDTLNVFCGSQFGIEFHQALYVQDALLENLVLGIEQTFLSLRMGLTYGPIESWEENQPCFSPGFHAETSL
jgi:hypothetical protein